MLLEQSHPAVPVSLVSWRAELQGEALRQVHGFPAPAFELLVRT